MNLVSPTFPNYCSERFLCFYINATSHLQVIKVTNIAGFYFEQIVFPGQRLLFEAFPGAQLDIFTSEKSHTVPMHTLACEQLQVKEPEVTLITR